MEVSHKARRWGAIAGLSLGVLTIALTIPGTSPSPPTPASAAPFAWDSDGRWQQLEATFVAARERGCATTNDDVTGHRAELSRALEALTHEAWTPDDPRFDALERTLFELAPRVAACPEHVGHFVADGHRLRSLVKRQSVAWDLGDRANRNRLYRLLYGSRAALEEVLLQLPIDAVPAISTSAVPAATPSTVVHGVTLHSGDLLLSRGGAPTSALIARGNDYPGNFSHVALVHVDDAGSARVIEAHIERGVAIATPEQYLADKKLRVLVLRMRPDHEALAADPMLAHRAATAALDEARARHIPYDFPMDFAEPRAQFCSEVAYQPYRAQGIELWSALSTMSTRGLVGWLASVGVEHFNTLAPSDLEYDPQLSIVAEFADPETLLADHIDNAIIDVMLEAAEHDGGPLPYTWWALPGARLLAGYSRVLNWFGHEGPIPEGMSPMAALRVKWLHERHARIKARVQVAMTQHRAEHGYVPAYWGLVAMAREAATVK